MFLRKALVVILPLLLCGLVCTVFWLLDSWLGSGDFFCYVVKGLLLGCMLSLLLPAAGIRVFTSGLPKWLWGSAGLCFAAMVLQYLQINGIMMVQVLNPLLNANGQVIFAEAVTAGFTALTGLLYHKR